jgi:branched-chain amino acid transport system substrate-binding protein
MRTARKIVAVAIPVVLALSACSSGGSNNGKGSTPLEIAVYSPFSGPNADYGFFEHAGCPPAVKLINAAGGVEGHTLYCKIVDNRGDPADAVPAAQQMLATSNNLVAIIDGDSGLLSSTVPLFDRAHIPDISAGGDVAFDKNHYQYFWRTIPGDDVSGYAVAAWAKKKGYTRTAAVFANDNASQGNVPGLLAGAKNLGITVGVNEAIALDQTSYETEIQKVVSTHPQAIATEADPQTGGVFYGQLKQAGGLVPIVGTSGTIGEDWNKAVIAAIGKADFDKYFTILTLYAPSKGQAWKTWDKALLASGSQVKKAAQYANQIYAEIPYDNVNLLALAMVAAHSTDPKVFNSYIPKVADGGANAVVVHTFAQGKKALTAGKHISYVGVTGSVHFDKYHNSAGVWADLEPDNNNKVVGILTPQEIAAAEGQ